MNRYICIHGHFYQPPRENPWLEEIELQDSAYPYSNWNERITAECYAPNVTSRILNEKEKIIDIINNYSRISFNFGPTLLSWMQKHVPEIYEAVLEADKESKKEFSGHGAALAQAYNHLIMPLTNKRDKRIQVIWGLRDFEMRFQRKPEGMWLPETAVDLETLEILAEFDIKFTILGPMQAKRVRRIGEKSWQDVSSGRIDPQRPYVCPLPSGKKIIIFFYDGPVSLDVAFRGLLRNGEIFANRLISTFPNDISVPRLVHIANDGETYGHHHRFGNMALSYLLHYVKKNKLAQPTIYGEFLEKFPPIHEVEIIENSSWSCSHGIERWRFDCGCSTGRNAKWNQQWRIHLREAMDWLRDQIIPVYERKMADLVKDPWEARDDYIHVIWDRSTENIGRFFKKHAQRDLNNLEEIEILKLLEMQRHTLLMFTSCGWFFDDVSGIETVQIIQYAARAIQLAREVLGIDLEKEYLSRLSLAKSNIPEIKDAKEIYESFVQPVVISLIHVGAHYAISSLFKEYPLKAQIYTYTVHNEAYDEKKSGKQRLVTGRALIRSNITLEEAHINFAVLHLGDHNLNAGVCFYKDDDSFKSICEKLESYFEKHNIPEVIHLMNHYFGDHNYTLWDLFRNEQGRVLDDISEGSLKTIEILYRQIYEQYFPLMQIRKAVHAALPKALAMTVEFILNRDLTQILEKDSIDLKRLEEVCCEINRWAFMRDKQDIVLMASRRINQFTQALLKNPQDHYLLETIEQILKILDKLSLNLDLWEAQNNCFFIAKKCHKEMLARAVANDPEAQQWTERFKRLAGYLKVETDEAIHK